MEHSLRRVVSRRGDTAGAQRKSPRLRPRCRAAVVKLTGGLFAQEISIPPVDGHDTLGVGCYNSRRSAWQYSWSVHLRHMIERFLGGTNSDRKQDRRGTCGLRTGMTSAAAPARRTPARDPMARSSAFSAMIAARTAGTRIGTAPWKAAVRAGPTPRMRSYWGGCHGVDPPPCGRGATSVRGAILGQEPDRGRRGGKSRRR